MVEPLPVYLFHYSILSKTKRKANVVCHIELFQVALIIRHLKLIFTCYLSTYEDTKKQQQLEIDKTYFSKFRILNSYFNSNDMDLRCL